jgi:hypothetical protein
VTISGQPNQTLNLISNLNLYIMKSLPFPHPRRKSLVCPLVISALLSISLLSSTTAQTGPEPIPDNITLGSRTYCTLANECATQSISNNGAVSISSGAIVTFEAGRQIHLKPGFHAAAGSKFRAQIGLSAANLSRPSVTDGAPAGLSLDSNNNGVPDLIELMLGLNLSTKNENDPRIQNMKNEGSRNYIYDKNSQLSNSQGERSFENDPEGNISTN